MRPPIGFDDPHTRRTRAWAERVADEAPGYYVEVLSDYRNRVAEFHTDVAAGVPDAFPWLAPTRVVVLCTQPAIWVFATPADGGVDEVLVDQQWEHPTLASPDVWSVPDPEVFVREQSALPLPDWSCIDVIDFRSTFVDPNLSLFANRRLPGMYVAGWILADDDRKGVEISDMVKGRSGRGIDRAALRSVSGRFADLEGITDPHARGQAFETWMTELLGAHGCAVERGKHVPGEQVDIFVHRPFRALVECRWRSNPAGRDAIDMLVGKLRRERPATVIGLSVSMSGFTAQAVEEVRRVAADRTVLLIDSQDIAELTTGRTHIADLIESRIDEVVRRYSGAG